MEKIFNLSEKINWNKIRWTSETSGLERIFKIIISSKEIYTLEEIRKTYFKQIIPLYYFETGKYEHGSFSGYIRSNRKGNSGSSSYNKKKMSDTQIEYAQMYLKKSNDNIENLSLLTFEIQKALRNDEINKEYKFALLLDFSWDFFMNSNIDVEKGIDFDSISKKCINSKIEETRENFESFGAILGYEKDSFAAYSKGKDLLELVKKFNDIVTKPVKQVKPVKKIDNSMENVKGWGIDIGIGDE